MTESYKTIKRRAESELVEKKSRFIATVSPVKTEKEAIELIEDMRSKYYDASHNVYAYVIGENNICRYSDDGEPSGTAGIPVLEIIKKENLIDVCVVVTRYFGGTLLGAGGLVRAYAQAAKDGLSEGEIIERTLCSLVMVSADYTLLGKIRFETENAGYTVKDIEYTDSVSVFVYVKKSETERYIKMITEKTNARCSIEVIGEEYQDL